MEFRLGSRQRAYDFIQGISEGDNLALLSHNDLDGISSAKVVNYVFKAKIVKFLSYSDLDENLVSELEMEGINKIIITDILITDRNFITGLEKFAEILILDHHVSVNDFNSKKCVFLIGEEGYCAAFLCYELLSEIKDLSNLDWLVACASISDFCNVKNEAWMKKAFKKYGEIYSSDMVKPGFDFQALNKSKFHRMQWDLTLALIYFINSPEKVFYSIKAEVWDIEDLGKYIGRVQGEIDSVLVKFETEKKSFPGGYYFEFKPMFQIGTIIGNIISIKYPDKNIIIVKPMNEGYTVNARRNDRKDSMPDLLKVCMKGFDDSNSGGHIPAAGGFFPKKYLEEFKRRLGVRDN